MAGGSLLSPRGRARAYTDVGERPMMIAAQRVRRRSWLTRLTRGLRQRRRVMLGVGALVPFAMLAGATTFWALTSPRFAVTTVEVHGVSRLTPEHVAELSGVAVGTNVFRVDTQAAVLRLQQTPEIRRA